MRLLEKNNFWIKSLIYILIGSVIGVSYISPVLYWFAFLGAFLFLLALAKENKRSATLWGSFVVFTTAFSWSLAWFYSMYPILWLPAEIVNYQITIITAYWLTSSLWQGMAGVFFGFGFWYLYRNYQNKLLLVPAIPILWVLTEILASFSFSVFTIGEHIVPNANFSFGYIGYILANNPITIQFAYLGGVYLMSFVVIFVTTLVWVFLNIDKSQIKNLIILAVFDTAWIATLILILIFKPTAVETDYQYSVAVIETEFSASVFKSEELFMARQEALSEAIKEAMKLNPTHIVLPEDSRLLDPNFTVPQTKTYLNFAYNYDGVLIDSGRKEYENGSVLRAMIYDGKANEIYQTDKQYLVPQGEFAPYLYTSLISQFMSKDTLMKIKKQFSYRPGPLVSQAKLPANIPAILFCFESVSPVGVKKITKDREVPFVVHPLSHSWFNEAVIFWHQLDNMLKVQAVWNQVDIVSIANKSQSKIYRKSGHIKIPETVKTGEEWKIYTVDI